MKDRRIRITSGFVLMISFLFYLDQGVGIFLPGLLACILHELGHIVAIHMLGGRVKGIQLTVAGAELMLDTAVPLSYFREAVAAIAGPLTSFLVAWVAAEMHRYLIAGLSLAAGLFNILPVWPLDGGRVFLSILYRFYGTEQAEKVMQFMSLGLIGMLSGLGIQIFLRFGNPTLCITAGFLLFGSMKKFFEK